MRQVAGKHPPEEIKISPEKKALALQAPEFFQPPKEHSPTNETPQKNPPPHLADKPHPQPLKNKKPFEAGHNWNAKEESH